MIEDFNVRGLTTRKGKAFSMSSFNALLKNRKYIGEYRYQDVVIPGGVPAIVSEKLFCHVPGSVWRRTSAHRHIPKPKKASFF